MKPYYEDAAVTIYHGDLRDVVPTLARESIDVVLTDPPFFMRLAALVGRHVDPRLVLGQVLEAVVPKVSRKGHFLAFCNGDSYPVFYPEMYRRFDFLKCLVWDKGHVGLGRVWRNQHELAIAARWNTSEFQDDGKLRSDIVQFKATLSAERLHPVEKPTKLLAWLLEPCVAPGGLVLDPFMGSGTTLDAARQLGMKSIGVETEERYCEVAAQRLGQGMLDFDSAFDGEAA